MAYAVQIKATSHLGWFKGESASDPNSKAVSSHPQTHLKYQITNSERQVYRQQQGASQQPGSDRADRRVQSVKPGISKQPLKPCREGANNPAYMGTQRELWMWDSEMLSTPTIYRLHGIRRQSPRSFTLWSHSCLKSLNFSFLIVKYEN